MSGLSEEEEKAQIERVKQVCLAINNVVHGETPESRRLAFMMLLAHECATMQNPDRAFLESMDAALSVFRDLTNTLYRNQDPSVS